MRAVLRAKRAVLRGGMGIVSIELLKEEKSELE
jgi:hypothetical protein